MVFKENEKKTGNKQSKFLDTGGDRNMKITITNNLQIIGAPEPMLKKIRSTFTLRNPAYDEAVKMDRWTGNLSKEQEERRRRVEQALIRWEKNKRPKNGSRPTKHIHKRSEPERLTK